MPGLAPPVVWAILLGVLGAIVGSLIAALVTRWPQGRSVVHGRSACDGCGRILRPFELIPLLSIIVLRGRCRDCGGRINPLHWRIELAGVAAGAVAGGVSPGLEGVAGAMFGWLLLALAALDIVAFWLPDRLTGALAVVGLFAAVLGVSPELEPRLIGGLAGFFALWLIAVAYRRLRRRGGMGGGDPKLFGAIGIWLGWRMLPAVLLLACVVGLGVVLLAYIQGRPMTRHTALPLGALLAIAAYPAWVAMIRWSP